MVRKLQFIKQVAFCEHKMVLPKVNYAIFATVGKIKQKFKCLSVFINDVKDTSLPQENIWADIWWDLQMCIHERKGSISFSSLTQDPFYGKQAAKQSQATVKLFKIKKKIHDV